MRFPRAANHFWKAGLSFAVSGPRSISASTMSVTMMAQLNRSSRSNRSRSPKVMSGPESGMTRSSTVALNGLQRRPQERQGGLDLLLDFRLGRTGQGVPGVRHGNHQIAKAV